MTQLPVTTQVPLEQLNLSELLEILRRHGYRVSPAVQKERLIHLINSGEPPRQEELSGTMPSRVRLEKWIDQNRTYISSQLPCTGPLQGRCTLYDCPDGRHLDCYLGAEAGGHLL